MPDYVYARSFKSHEDIVKWAMDLARKRDEMHRRQKSYLPLSKNSGFIGLMGEVEFSLRYDFPIDATMRAGGDDGIDFDTPAGTVDVKTFQLPRSLLLAANKDPNKLADILMLAGYDKYKQKARLLGWEYTETILRCPTRHFHPAILSHYMEKSKLRRMKQWEDLLARCRQPKML